MTEIYGVLELSDIDANHAEWLKVRNSGIGSSDIATLAGLNEPYSSPLSLWLEKTGKVPAQETNEAMELGHHMEPFIGRMWSKRKGLPVYSPKAIYRHPEHKVALASPDFFIDAARRGLGILEAKNTSFHRSHEWIVDEDGKQLVPMRALIQLHWQMGTIGPRFGAIAGLVGGNTNGFADADFDYDSELYDHSLDLAYQFMDLIQKDMPPQAGPGDLKHIMTYTEKMKSGAVELPIEYLATVERYDTLRNERLAKEKIAAEIKKEEETIKNNLILDMAGAESGIVAGTDWLVSVKKSTVEPFMNKGYDKITFAIKNIAPKVKPQKARKAK